MFDRFVSVFSLFVVLTSALVLAISSLQVAGGTLSEGSGLFISGGCAMAMFVFTYLFLDPADVDAVSIVKSA